MCLRLLFVISLWSVALCFQRDSELVCDPSIISGNCIGLSKIKKTYMNANDECLKRNGTLITIMSRTDQKAVTEFLRQIHAFSGPIWIGLHGSADQYVWTSGFKGLPSTYFASSTNPLSMECVALNVSESNGVHNWFSLPCDDKLPYICEHKKNEMSTLPDIALNLNESCPAEFYSFEGRCIQVITSPVSWQEARLACSNVNSTLVTVNSASENDRLLVLGSSSNDSLWLGLYMDEQGERKWESGDAIGYTSWSVGEPLDEMEALSSKRRCSVLQPGSGLWLSENCDIKHGYICQTNPNAQFSNQTASSLFKQGQCKADFYEFQGRCYRRPVAHLSDARAAVEEPCTHRLFPRSAAEWAFLRLLLKQNPVGQLAWIGAELIVSQNEYRQLRVLSEDGESITFLGAFDWNKLPPGPLTDARFCLAMDRSNFSVLPVDCSQPLPSVCGYDLPDRVKSEPLMFVPECPPNWTVLGSKCLSEQFVSPRTWQEADVACRRLHSAARLFAPDNELEVDWINQRTNAVPHWIGLRATVDLRRPNATDWHWSCPTASELAMPVDVRPTDRARPTSCLVAGHWRSVDCADRHPFVCQLRRNRTAENNNGPASSSQSPIETCLDRSWCVRLHFQPRPFLAAAESCTALGQQALATVLTDKQQAFAMQLLRKHFEHQQVFFGLFSQDGSSHWISAYPSIPITFWHNQTQNAATWCAAMDTSLPYEDTWRMVDCDRSLPFLCSSVPHRDASQQLAQQQSYECPPNYTLLATGCFLIQTEDLSTWSAANQSCSRTARNAHLATISSLAENDGISLLVERPVWIGLSSAGHAHTWADSSPALFTNWAPNQPSGPSSSCVRLHSQTDNAGLWEDADCQTRLGYVCQAAPVPSSEAGFPYAHGVHNLFASGRCTDPHMVQFQDSCYTVPSDSLHPARSPWELRDAVTDRCDPEGHPAVPRSDAEAAFMRALVHRFAGPRMKFWLGAKALVNGSQLRLVSESGRLELTDPIDFAWVLQQPRRNSPVYACLSASTNETRWLLGNCSSPDHSVVCRHYLATAPPPAVLNQCPAGWQLIGGACFRATGLTERLSWSEAEQACVRSGAHLASLHDPSDVEAVSQLIDSGAAWIGLRALLASHRAPIRFVWSDASPVDLFVYPVGLDEANVERCISLDPGGGWIAGECFQPRGFVCKLVQGEKPVQSVTAADDCNGTRFPLATGSACYALVQPTEPLNWTSAETACAALQPGAHLASVRSAEEHRQLSAVLAPWRGRAWVGLFESAQAYAWSDGSPVEFVPKSADHSKDHRHLLQDCFLLDATVDNLQPAPLLATNCSERQSAFVCQHRKHPVESTPEQADTQAQSTVKCPLGYWPFANRCFMILNNPLSWKDANNRCAAIAAGYGDYVGSLARIESTPVQEFVSSLLENIKPGFSVAWIGLYQEASSAPQRWTDNQPVRYLRSIFRQRSLEKPVSGSAPLPTSTSDEPLCTALYRSTLVGLNGLWLQQPCASSGHMPVICQAVPRHPEPQASVSPGDCPAGFQRGPPALTQPACFRLLGSEERLSWTAAKQRCEQLSSAEHRVSLFWLASVFEANLVRSWLPQNTTVWTALRVTHQCPQCFANWTWSTNPPEPVRYTDWAVAPGLPSGCHVFATRPDAVGSQQPVADCSALHRVLCRSVRAKDRQQQQQPDRASCRVQTNARTPSVQVDLMNNVSVTHSGKPCIRWDLVQTNLTDFRLDSNWLRHRLVASDEVGGDNAPSYAENFCSQVYDSHQHSLRYGCHYGPAASEFEDCVLYRCSGELVPRRSISLGSVVALSMVAVIVLSLAAFAAWRCWCPLHVGYKRFSNTPRFHLHRNRVLFADDEDAFDQQLNRNEVSLLDRHHDQNAVGPTEPSVSFGSYLGSVVFQTPSYAPLAATSPDIDYDPEA